MKKGCSCSRVIITVIGVMAALPLILMLVVGLLFKISDDSRPPEITRAEFPIELTYKKDGETITTNVTYVGEYTGSDPRIGGYSWKGYIKGTKEEGILIFSQDKIKVFCVLGVPDYYMGDGEYDKEKFKPHIVKKEKTLFDTKVSVLSQSDLYEQYNIEIISWKIPDPIENTFY